MRAHVMALLAVALLTGTAACSPASSGPAASAPARSVPAPSRPTQVSATPSLASATASELSGSGSTTEFNGHVVCGSPVRTETSRQAGDHQEFRGGAWAPTATEMSDPRLDGDITISENSNVYSAPGSTMNRVDSDTWRIETEDGAWETSSTVVGFPDGSYSTVTTPLVGEGAYDGLFAVWEVHYLGDAACAWDVRGVIFPAGPPEPPTAP